MVEKEKQHNFKKIEQKWQKKWEKEKVFQTKEGKKKKYYVLEMYPYPSGSGLHMGHAFNYTIGDIYSRFKRMQGMSVLYPMGYDSFGLPAENAAIKAGKHPKKHTESAIKNYIKQQKELGLSYDWDRMLMSHDPNYYKWNQYWFLKFYEKGLVYRKKAPVNYCEKCMSVLANEQVHNGKCWRHEDTEVEIKQLEQWFLRTTAYADELLKDIEKLQWPEKIKIMQKNWIGKKHGYMQYYKVNDMDIVLDTFTTHHHTSFAEIFIAIAPEHPIIHDLVKGTKYEQGAQNFINNILKKKASGDFSHESAKDGFFIGRYVKDFCSGRDLPIYIADFALMDFGTGIVKASVHDQRDFDFARAHGIKPYEVLFPNKLIEKNKTKNSVEYEVIHPGLDEKTMESYAYSGKYNEKTIGTISVKIDKKTINVEVKIQQDAPDKALQEESVLRQLAFMFFNKGFNKLIVKFENFSSQMHTMEEMGFVWNNGFFELEKGKGKVPYSYDGQGYMFDSKQFSGMSVPEAKIKMGGWMEKNKFAKKTIIFGLKDWLVSRQRYWGTPIPMIYCKKCGIVPVKEKDLPVKLPEKIKFGKGNPLLTNEKFVNTKCPKCKGKAKRETDTMDTFFDSSWYFLRYCDNKNKKAPFDKKKVNYWMPVDQYIGGAEHACMHLIYARFFTKALRDLKFVKSDEPFTKLFNQGMLHGNDGFVMSKSRGNVVLPEKISKKYGIDTARLFLVSIASPDKDLQWSDSGIQGSYKFVRKVLDYFDSVKPISKSKEKVISKYNSTIRDYTKFIENFDYNLAVIKIRELFESFSAEGESKEILEGFLKMLHPICPHITEEIWHGMGNKKLLTTQTWPKHDEKKINKKFEQQEQIINKTISDINNIIRIIKEKNKKDTKKVYLYVLPNELDIFINAASEIKTRTQKQIQVFSVSDKNKHDPENKSGKAKPGKPGVYVD